MERVVIRFIKGYNHLLLGSPSATSPLIPIYCFITLLMRCADEERVSDNDVKTVTRLMRSTEFGGQMVLLTLKNTISGIFPPPKQISQFVVPWFVKFATFAPDSLTAFCHTAFQELDLPPARQSNIEIFLR